MSKTLKIAYMSGGSDFTVGPLYALLRSKHELKIIYTKNPKKLIRTRKNIRNFLIDEAEKNNLKTTITDSFNTNDYIVELKKFNLDLIIVYAYGVILPREVLNIPRYGCINIHTSLLPKWRGASPIQHALINNDRETGFTFIAMNEELDKGDILFKKKILISKEDNYGVLLKKITKLASDNLIPIIDKFILKKINITKQDDKKATYCYKIKKEDTYIRFDEKAENIYGKIRAFTPTPGAKCFIKGELVRIIEAEVEEVEYNHNNYGKVLDNNLLVACKTGSIRLIKIQRQGRKPMLVKDVLNGWKIEKGLILNEN